jgi:hypothetical protein
MTCAPDALRLRLPPCPANRRGPWPDSGAAEYCRRRDRCRSKTGRHVAGSCGAVTAEFAVTLPAVLLLLAMLLAGAAAGVTQLRLEEGARAGVRALARGDDSAAVERIVRTLSGASASAVVAAEGEWLSVTVTDRVGGPLGASIPWTLTARASTRSETATARLYRPNHWGTYGGGAAGELHVRLAVGAGAGT